MRRTDVGRIEYLEGTNAADRRHCRSMVAAVASLFVRVDLLVVSCSGGLDSTVLTHAVSQALKIRPVNNYAGKIEACAVYLNHNFRPAEVKIEAEHVDNISSKWLTFSVPAIKLNVSKGSHLQERARDARYEALLELCRRQALQFNKSIPRIDVLTAHNLNDVVETKLFQFLKGRAVTGIPSSRRLGNLSEMIFLARPFLNFSRKDIKRYAECFGLTWCEDSSNGTDDYTRNRIRHHLIPWIESNINPGILKTLG